MSKIKLLTPLFLALLFAERTTHPKDNSEPKRVGQVDLDRYVGLWYEIARIPNRFQKQCARGVTAEYTLRGDGRIDVVNRCYQEDGKLDEAEGLARIEDKKTNSQLKVSFFSIFARISDQGFDLDVFEFTDQEPPA